MGIASLHPSYVLHQKLLTLWNAIVSDNLPACTRYAQSLQGLPKTFSRADARGFARATGRDQDGAGGLGALSGKRIEAAE